MTVICDVLLFDMSNVKMQIKKKLIIYKGVIGIIIYFSIRLPNSLKLCLQGDYYKFTLINKKIVKKTIKEKLYFFINTY